MEGIFEIIEGEKVEEREIKDVVLSSKLEKVVWQFVKEHLNELTEGLRDALTSDYGKTWVSVLSGNIIAVTLDDYLGLEELKDMNDPYLVIKLPFEIKYFDIPWVWQCDNSEYGPSDHYPIAYTAEEYENIKAKILKSLKGVG